MQHFFITGGYVVLVALYSYFLTHVIPRRYYSVSNLLVSLVSIAYALIVGLIGSDIGLAISRIVHGFWVGFLISLPVMAVLPFVIAHRHTRPFFMDKPTKHFSVKQAVLELVVRIPFGTALSEEIIFRGVLFGLLLTYYGTHTALIVGALIFGLWHVLPTLRDMEENDALTLLLENKRGKRHIPLFITVVTTTLVGLFFGWLRLLTGSVVTAWIVHTAINSFSVGGGYVLIWKDRQKKRVT